jgi:hypothetical protein
MCIGLRIIIIPPLSSLNGLPSGIATAIPVKWSKNMKSNYDTQQRERANKRNFECSCTKPVLNLEFMLFLLFQTAVTSFQFKMLLIAHSHSRLFIFKYLCQRAHKGKLFCHFSNFRIALAFYIRINGGEKAHC